MSIKTNLASLAALTLAAAVSPNELRINPSSIQTTLASKTISGKHIHDYFTENPQEQRELEQILQLQQGTLALYFDNTYSPQNPEFEGWETRDGRLLIYSTDKPRQGRVEQGQLITTGYRIESFNLPNQQSFEELYRRIWLASQKTPQEPPITEHPRTYPQTQQTQQEPPRQYQPPTTYKQHQRTEQNEQQKKPKKSRTKRNLSDLEIGLIGAATGFLLHDLIDNNQYKRHRRYHYPRYEHSRRIFRDKRPMGYYPYRRCR